MDPGSMRSLQLNFSRGKTKRTQVSSAKIAGISYSMFPILLRMWRRCRNVAAKNRMSMKMTTKTKITVSTRMMSTRTMTMRTMMRRVESKGCKTFQSTLTNTLKESIEVVQNHLSRSGNSLRATVNHKRLRISRNAIQKRNQKSNLNKASHCEQGGKGNENATRCGEKEDEIEIRASVAKTEGQMVLDDTQLARVCIWKAISRASSRPISRASSQRSSERKEAVPEENHAVEHFDTRKSIDDRIDSDYERDYGSSDERRFHKNDR